MITQEYETQCVEAVAKILTESSGVKTYGVVLEGVEVVGPPTNRLLLAHILHERRGQRETLEWRLGRDWFSGRPPPGEHEYPSSVALQMLLWALGD